MDPYFEQQLEGTLEPEPELDFDDLVDPKALGLALIIAGLAGNILGASICIDESEMWGYLQYIGSGLVFTLFNWAIVHGTRLIWWGR